mgnify:CR=1 FL=1
MRTLMQLHEAIQPYKAKTDLSGYIHLCVEIGPSYNQGLDMAAALWEVYSKYLPFSKYKAQSSLSRACVTFFCLANSA